MTIPVGQISEAANFLTAAGGSVVGGGAVVFLARFILRRFLRDLDEIKKRQDDMDDDLAVCVKKTDCRDNQSGCASNIGRTLDEIKGMIKTLDERIYSLVASRRSNDENNR